MIAKPSVELKTPSKWYRRWEVESSAEADKMYIVGMDDDGNFKCECPHFRFRKEPCKHIIHIIRMLNTKEL